MRDIFKAHRNGFWTVGRRRSLYVGFLLIGLSLVIQIAAGHYSSVQSTFAAPQSDLFLDNIPIVPLGFLIVGMAILFWVLSWSLLVAHPRQLLFGMKAIALFIITRAIFINLTREGVYPNSFVPTAQNLGFGVYSKLTFQGNLFFSGHTGFPFLMALIFWSSPFWRRFFLFFTFVFGAAVLLAHVHYSIDVFAAPFIIYGVYVVTAKLFPEDYALSESAKT